MVVAYSQHFEQLGISSLTNALYKATSRSSPPRE